MQISENTRGALYMCIAMAAFTVNDSFMKAATQVLPLFQAITLRGFLCVLGLGAIATATGGLWPKLNRKDAIALIVRSVA
ncbi:MAG: EamA/RhaT family transporter, partial [Rhodoferax sp.]|nr:EamA/RhaT family transporter [Pseudorhodobacter sp.]